ncbi:MAG: purine-nucleoside phosphorylase [Candidatus Firestonebacteria bacterium RIFOXYC2_FULL_39_67]|nr:MAG: purine-nucleoside phosphorylase [Candidatus Firestonebacteria bacterium RIFOXYD2_FULL_39_29]OGF53621.1 MAG: purine-nucleoside phosphorylase [Candidatus Firestonebacteria bacterium RifOxyC12_full_39_7]OGF54077.1 MAG: purine-nucleoside phosphorylase [Candidatus Firestonebacteria bacterium RIFOXYC2_FULL_39_67]
MSELSRKIEQAVLSIKKQSRMVPDIAIILGTGLGGLVNEITDKTEINYKDIKGFPLSTVEAHAGKLILGEMGGKKVVAMQGRFHRYEGYSYREVTFPVYVMKELGAKILMVSNAAGGLNKEYEAGELMMISDHNSLLLGDNPLAGPNDDKIGSRWPDMFQTYDVELMKLAEKIAKENKIKLHKGVYVGVIGPNLETEAEYKFLIAIGGDAVGMSTVPEVIVARHCGFRVLGISVITDMCIPGHLEIANIEKIIGNASRAEPKLTKIMSLVVKEVKL